MSQMILDEGETFEDLPPDIILQRKCPYYEDFHRMRLMGPKNGSWTLHETEPVKTICLDKDPYNLISYGIQCLHTTGRTYEITSRLYPFFMTPNCSMRLFLGEVAFIKQRRYSHWIITNDHGLKGLSKEISAHDFAEAPYFNHTYDAMCDEEENVGVNPSKNGSFDRRPRTDIILIFCGVAMASVVLSF
ncbi:unnamed protein product [Lymnaea stagnalis]|uniref:Uncharacterized protein n=1 Tax=Lymnaea stagnalis TaxID=6523 RepID=A0AAV2HNT4_LYMST